MTTIDVRFNEAEHRRVIASLNQLIRDGEDLSPAMLEVSELLAAIAERSFDAERSPDGVPWAPLAPATVRQKRKAGRSEKILEREGDLKSSILSDHDRRSAAAGTNLVYAAIHQFGGTIQRSARSQVLAFAARGGRFTSRAAASRRRAGSVRVSFAAIGAHNIDIPARPFLGVGQGDADAILDIVAEHLAEGWGVGVG